MSSLINIAIVLVAGVLAVSSRADAQNLFWLTPKKDNCIALNKRQWSAIISGTDFHGDWLDACRTTPNSISGQTLDATRCTKEADLRVWGTFSVDDTSCAPRFDAPKDDGCIREGVRGFSAIITGYDPGGNWTSACMTTALDLAGVLRTPVRCSTQADSRVWGAFEVPDPTCPKVTRVGPGCATSEPQSGSLVAFAIILAVRQLRRRSSRT